MNPKLLHLFYPVTHPSSPHRVKAKASTPDHLSSKVTDISTAFTLRTHLIEVKLMFDEIRWLGCSTFPTLKPCWCHLFLIKPLEVSCWNSLRSSFWEWGLPYFRHLSSKIWARQAHFRNSVIVKGTVKGSKNKTPRP